FDPDDTERLRGHNLPFLCGLYPDAHQRALACELLPGATALRLGRFGGLVEVVSCGLGFALLRRAVCEAIRDASAPGEARYFGADAAGTWEAEDAAFCARVRAAGFVL